MKPLAARHDRPQLEQLSDAEVVSRVIAGDTGLFELIMRRYNRRIFRIARGILGDDADAEDATQDAYIDAFFKLNQFRGPVGFASWICRIGTNHALMRRRKRRSFESIEVLDQADQEISPMSSTTPRGHRPDSEAQDGQLRVHLERAVDELPAVYRDAFVLCDVEGLTLAETAELLDANVATIKTRVFRARRLLRKRLTDQLDGILPELFGFDGDRCDRLVEKVFQRLNQTMGNS